MELPNPHSDKPFDQILKNKQGDDEYGIRQVDGHEEIVHIPTKTSNMKYWQPEMVMDPSCGHEFVISDLGLREIECTKCPFTTKMHLGINTSEGQNGLKITIKGQEYSISNPTSL